MELENSCNVTRPLTPYNCDHTITKPKSEVHCHGLVLGTCVPGFFKILINYMDTMGGNDGVCVYPTVAILLVLKPLDCGKYEQTIRKVQK